MGRIRRKVGKYTIEVSSNEINGDNFFKYSVYFISEDSVYIDGSELSLDMASTFRYSNNEEEVRQALKMYIENLKFRITRTEQIL